MRNQVEFDDIVLGAGSAGCVVAARLSEDPHRRVLLVEAGGRDWNPLLRVPLMTGLLLRGRHATWRRETEPEPHLNGRRLTWPSGRVLGGSSAINGMVYTRGRPMDYDGWAQLGLPGWSFADVLPYFKRSEARQAGPDPWHGADGPLPVSRPGTPNPLFDAFLQAGRQAGFPVADDFNAPGAEGFGRYDFTTRAGSRWSTARAFLDPARGRPNLTILTDAVVGHIVVVRGRAVGVELVLRGRPVRVEAAHEVVLCCGTVASPAVLMRSGIGQADALRRLGIAVVADLPGVGENLQDHLLARVEHACREPLTLHGLTRPDRALRALAEAMVFGRGPAASFPLEAGAFLKSDPALDEPDLQSHFLPGLSSAALRLPFVKRPSPAHDGHGFLANVYQLRPQSRGSVTLRSADPREAPLIRPNYLSAPNDRRVLRDGVKILRRVFGQSAFDRYRGPELSPGPSVEGDADIDAWLSRTADTVFHPVGTCRMGPDGDAGAVLDAALRVRGVEALRVADASAMPRMPSGNTNAPTIMIGEKAADLVRGISGA